MPQTLTEKVLSRVMGRAVKLGETIYPEPDLITTHDLYTVNFDKALQKLGVRQLYAPEKVLISTDHEPVAGSKIASERQMAARAAARKYGIKHFYDAGRGGHGHIFPMELGFIKPGMFVIGYDTHVPNYGAVGCIGVPVVTEITEVLACGSVWMRVPETIRVNLRGRLRPGVAMRDVAQKLSVTLDASVVDYCVVEYGGAAFEHIGFGPRMTLCNTPLELGAKSAVVEPDAFILGWLRAHGVQDAVAVKSDAGARFKQVVELDLATVTPQVAVPPIPDNVVDIEKVLGTVVHHAFVGSCANGSLDDMRDVATILKGRKLADSVRMIITPGTQEIASAAAREGLLQIFIDAGCSLTAPGCGPCATGRVGSMAPGETSINTGTRNDPGRLGAVDSDIYLASPMTVAASAVAGKIVDPRDFIGTGAQS